MRNEQRIAVSLLLILGGCSEKQASSGAFHRTSGAPDASQVREHDAEINSGGEGGVPHSGGEGGVPHSGLLVGSKTIFAARDIRLLAGFTGLTGDLTVASEDLTDLKGLEGITYLGGSLIVVNSAMLLNLSGLEQLRFIGGSLNVYDNLSLEDIGALRHLEIIVDRAWFEDNPSLHRAQITKLATQTKHEIGSCGSADDARCD